MEVPQVCDLIHAEKHRQKGETFKSAMARIANHLKDDDEHFKVFKGILYDRRFLPGGRIQASAGSNRITTCFNCYVLNTIPDSMEGIMDTLKEAALTLKMGGGVGYDFSTLRPKHAIIKTLDSFSSGPVSFMEIFNSMCATISSAGHRRG